VIRKIATYFKTDDRGLAALAFNQRSRHGFYERRALFCAFREIVMKPMTILAILSAVGLAACQAPREVQVSQPQRVAPIGVEGNWVDPNGIVSTFSGGQFQTRTSDGTNTQLASGTYSTTGNVTQINLYSNIKQTTSLVNCALVTGSQLNCTTETGAQFSLTRRV
jgi:hypothetical protein